MRFFLLFIALITPHCIATSQATDSVSITELIAAGENQSDLVTADPNALTVIDLGGPWCMPCRRDEPYVRATVLKNGAQFVDINIDHHPGLLERAGSSTVPYYLVYNHGALVHIVDFKIYKTTETPAETEARINARFAPILAKYASP